MANRMTSVEIQAFSVDEAIRLALEQLDLNEGDVDIEVLSDAGPDEDAEALVRVTAKGMASQPVPSSKPSQGGGGNRAKTQRRAPGDRPSQRGEGHRRERQPAPPPRTYDPNRADSEDELIAKEIVAELLAHMGIDAEVVATDNPSSMESTEDE